MAAAETHGVRDGSQTVGSAAEWLALGNLSPVTTATTQLWLCSSCGWIYDPAEGDPDGGIPSGTAFEDIPEDWFCPVCGARKSDFEPYAG